MACQHLVHENTKGCRNDERQQRQHERAGKHADKHAPGPVEQGVQLAEQTRPLAAGLEVGAPLESQRNPAVVLGEFLGGEGASPGSRVIEMEVAVAVAFENHEVAELPKQNQRQLHLLQLFGAQAEAAALKSVVPGGAHDAGGAAAVPADLALFAQLGQRHPAPEVGQHAA